MWFSWNPRWRLRSGIGRTDEGRYSEGDHDRPQPNLIAVGQPQGRRHLPFGNERSILASKIFDRRFLPGEDDPRVTARDACGVDPDRGVRRAAEDALAIGQWNLARLPDDPAPGGGTRRLVIGERLSNVADEPVPESVDGSDEPRMTGGISQGTSDLLHETGQVGVEDEGRRPQVRLQLVPCHDTSVVRDEQEQEIECLAGEVYLLAAAKEPAGVRVQNETIQAVRHTPSGSQERNANPFLPARILSDRAGAAMRRGAWRREWRPWRDNTPYPFAVRGTVSMMRPPIFWRRIVRVQVDELLNERVSSGPIARGSEWVRLLPPCYPRWLDPSRLVS